MTAARNAQTAALETLVEAHARELHLPAVRQRFRALAAEAAREQQTPLAYLAALLESEVTSAGAGDCGPARPSAKSIAAGWRW